MKWFTRWTATVGMAVATSASLGAAEARYGFERIPTGGVAVSEVGAWINNRGEVAFTYFPEGRARAALYSGGEVTVLPTLGGDVNDVSFAYGLNDLGVVVGQSTLPDGRTLGFLSSGGQTRSIGALGTGDGSTALAINNAGLVVGGARNAPGDGQPYRAVLFSPAANNGAGLLTDLGVLPGGEFSLATAINEAGLIAGYGSTSASPGERRPYRVVVFANDRLLDLGSGPNGNQGVAAALDERGRVVVNSSNFVNGASSPSRPCRLENFSYTDLLPSPTLPATAAASNSAGDVVGTLTGGSNRAALFRGGTVIDLNGVTRGQGDLRLESATDINNRGQIAGLARDPQGKLVAFVLTPAPVLTITTRGGRTPAAAVEIRGRVAGFVDELTCRIGASGSARPVRRAGDAWSVRVPLRPGVNVVTIRAAGPGGSVDLARVRFVRR